MSTARRLPFLLPGGASLLLGLYAALVLLGVPNVVNLDRIGEHHAPLLVYGFVGTLIVLERTVAARRRWGYFAPALIGLGALSLLTPLPDAVGKGAVAAGFALLVAIYGIIWLRQPAASTAIQVLGAGAALASTVLWFAGVPVADLVPTMTAFLVLTIVGERLELGRISPTVTRRVEGAGLAVSVGLAASAMLAPLNPELGYRLLGLSLLVLVGWAIRFDVATRLVRSSGLPRYMAVCLLAGYVWLVLAGGVWLVAAEPTSGWLYDAVLHAVFLGFVVSMIMAHAPVILPAVLRVPLPYRPFLYLPVAVLHVALVVRVVGDAVQDAELVRLGGIGNVTALLLFAVLAVTTALMGVPKRPVASGGRGAAASRTATEPDPVTAAAEIVADTYGPPPGSAPPPTPSTPSTAPGAP